MIGSRRVTGPKTSLDDRLQELKQVVTGPDWNGYGPPADPEVVFRVAAQVLSLLRVPPQSIGIGSGWEIIVDGVYLDGCEIAITIYPNEAEEHEASEPSAL